MGEGTSRHPAAYPPRFCCQFPDDHLSLHSRPPLQLDSAPYDTRVPRESATQRANCSGTTRLRHGLPLRIPTSCLHPQRELRAKTVKRRPDGTASPLGPAARSAHSGHNTGSVRSHVLRPDSGCWSLTPAAYTAPACPGLDACKEKLLGPDLRFPSHRAVLGQDAEK